MPADLSAIHALLTSLHLPTQDLGAPHQKFFVARDGTEFVGCVAVEKYGSACLLRSLAVAVTHQGCGVGTKFLSKALTAAAEEGSTDVFLLTTTAEGFFVNHGFTTVTRGSVPLPVRESPEFRALCPATAICMHRRLV